MKAIAPATTAISISTRVSADRRFPARLNFCCNVLTEIRTGAKPLSIHSTPCRQTFLITQSPISRMSPVCSATGMNSAGEMAFSSGFLGNPGIGIPANGGGSQAIDGVRYLQSQFGAALVRDSQRQFRTPQYHCRCTSLL